MHYRMLSSIPGLYLLDAISILSTPVVATQSVPRYRQMSPYESRWLKEAATDECPSLLSLDLSCLCPEATSHSEMAWGHPHTSPLEVWEPVCCILSFSSSA